jgi:hypothetical protein
MFWRYFDTCRRKFEGQLWRSFEYIKLNQEYSGDTNTSYNNKIGCNGMGQVFVEKKWSIKCEAKKVAILNQSWILQND